MQVNLPVDNQSQRSQSDRESDKLMTGQEYLSELAANCDRNEEHVNLSHLNSAICSDQMAAVDYARQEEQVYLPSLNNQPCSELEVQKLEREYSSSDVEIPSDEDEEVKDDEPQSDYVRKLDFRYPPNLADSQNRRRTLMELHDMGFQQFSINMLVVDRTSDNVQEAVEILLNE